MNNWFHIPSYFQSVCSSQWAPFLGEVVNFCQHGLPRLVYGALDRDANLYQRANNVGVKKNHIWGKIFAKFYAVLSVKSVMAQFCIFWWHFIAHFGTLCYFFGIFCSILVLLVFYAVLLQIRFVVIYALFQLKYFLLKPCQCKKKFFLHVWP